MVRLFKEDSYDDILEPRTYYIPDVWEDWKFDIAQAAERFGLSLDNLDYDNNSMTVIVTVDGYDSLGFEKYRKLYNWVVKNVYPEQNSYNFDEGIGESVSLKEREYVDDKYVLTSKESMNMEDDLKGIYVDDSLDILEDELSAEGFEYYDEGQCLEPKDCGYRIWVNGKFKVTIYYGLDDNIVFNIYVKEKDNMMEGVEIEVKNKGVLEVPEGKTVDQLPMSHFEKLAKKKGLSKITKALNNLQVWNKNDDPKLSKWAGNMIDKLNKKLKKDENLSVRDAKKIAADDESMGMLDDIAKMQKNRSSRTEYEQKDDDKKIKDYVKRINDKLSTKESLLREDEYDDNTLLGRLVSDCNYFLGSGNGYEGHLWAHSVEDQIHKMRDLYDNLIVKPNWLTPEDIDDYEEKMLALKYGEPYSDVNESIVKESPMDYLDTTTRSIIDKMEQLGYTGSRKPIMFDGKPMGYWSKTYFTDKKTSSGIQVYIDPFDGSVEVQEFEYDVDTEDLTDICPVKNVVSSNDVIKIDRWAKAAKKHSYSLNYESLGYDRYDPNVEADFIGHDDLYNDMPDEEPTQDDVFEFYVSYCMNNCRSENEARKYLEYENLPESFIDSIIEEVYNRFDEQL